MRNQNVEFILRNSVHSVYARLAAVVCSVLALIIGWNLLRDGFFAYMDAFSLLYVIFTCVLICNAGVLWILSFASRKSELYVAVVMKLATILLFGIAAVALIVIAASIFLYGDQREISRNITSISEMLTLFSLEGIIGIAVFFVWAFVYDVLALTFIFSLANVYQDVTDRITGRLLSIFSFIHMAISLVCIPVAANFEDVAFQLGIDTNIIRLPQISFDFDQATQQEKMNLAFMILIPVLWLLIGIVTKTYADQKNILKDALEGKMVFAPAYDAQAAQWQQPYIAPTYPDEPAASFFPTDQSYPVFDTSQEALEAPQDFSFAENPVVVPLQDSAEELSPAATMDDPSDAPAETAEEMTVRDAADSPSAPPSAAPQTRVSYKPRLIPGTSLYDFGYSENRIQ